MKLYELLNEDAYRAKDFFKDTSGMVKIVLERGEKVVAFLNKNCQSWLSQTDNGKQFVYRGFSRGSREMVFTKKVRKNREPKDSRMGDHNAYNFMIKQCGGVANRSNALFTTGDEYTADDYGDLFIVLPTGNFKYTWHEDHADWHGDVEWGRILRKQPPKSKTISKEEYNANYTKLNAEHRKTSDATLDKVTKIFAKYGIKVMKNNFGALANVARAIKPKVNYNYHTLDMGTPKKPFPLAKKGKKATVAHGHYYWETKTVTSMPFKKLYDIIISSNTAKRQAIRKDVMTIVNQINKATIAQRWLKRNVDVAAYTNNERDDERENQKIPFNPTDDKPNTFDKASIKKWCSKLHADDGSLTKGIRAENEIMIACNTVIAINPVFYEKVVIPMLQGKIPKLSEYDASDILQNRDPDEY